VAEAARRHALTVAEIEDWQERFFLAAEDGLRSRPKDEEAVNPFEALPLEAGGDTSQPSRLRSSPVSTG
jgi:hypothetical protein